VLTLQEITPLIPLEIVVDAEFETLGFLSDRLPRMLTFIEDPKFLRQTLSHDCVAAVLTGADISKEIPIRLGLAITAHPRRDFARVHNLLAGTTDFYGARHPSEIDSSAKIHPRAAVALENVQIGPGVVVEANAVIGSGCVLEREVIVRAGAVLGATGFQTYRDESGYIEMTHAGMLVVEERAQIFSNATVARGLFRQTTRIGPEVRVGNNAFVSHNVQVGARSFVGHGAVVNGNTRIGQRAWIGPGAVLSNGLSVGDEARISLGSVVIRDVAPGEHVSGNFAVTHRELLHRMAGT
jgi:UDP-3-O-[3-hydroxymyristoyl] glucosamine N-acyltransferase